MAKKLKGQARRLKNWRRKLSIHCFSMADLYRDEAEPALSVAAFYDAD
jgi:hypothetical protein